MEFIYELYSVSKNNKDYNEDKLITNAVTKFIVLNQILIHYLKILWMKFMRFQKLNLTKKMTYLSHFFE